MTQLAIFAAQVIRLKSLGASRQGKDSTQQKRLALSKVGSWSKGVNIYQISMVCLYNMYYIMFTAAETNGFNIYIAIYNTRVGRCEGRVAGAKVNLILLLIESKWKRFD